MAAGTTPGGAAAATGVEVDVEVRAARDDEDDTLRRPAVLRRLRRSPALLSPVALMVVLVAAVGP